MVTPIMWKVKKLTRGKVVFKSIKQDVGNYEVLFHSIPIFLSKLVYVEFGQAACRKGILPWL